MARSELSQGAKLAFGRLCQHAGKHAYGYPKLSTLAKELGVKQRQVKNYIVELEAARLIEVLRTGRASRYYFLEHPWIEWRASKDTSEVQESAEQIGNQVPNHIRDSKREPNKENHTRREPRRSSSFLEDEESGYSESETEVIALYHDALPEHQGWLRVNQFSPEVCSAINDFVAEFRHREDDTIPEFFESVASHSDEVRIPKKRTLVRLLRENANHFRYG